MNDTSVSKGFTKIKRTIRMNLGNDECPMMCEYPCSITLSNDELSKMTDEQIDRLFADSTKAIASADVSYGGTKLFSNLTPKLVSIDKDS